MTDLGISTELVAADLPTPIVVHALLGGVQAIFRFPNGYGASVINHRGSYGTELAVLHYHGEGEHDYELTYSTPITNDVVGHIEGPAELIELLVRIRDLPPAGRDHDRGYPDGGNFAEAVSSLGRMLL